MVLFDLYSVPIFSLDIFSMIHINTFSVTDLTDGMMIFAQNMGGIKKINIMDDISKSWKNFVQTGQVWAMLIGVFFGYTFRSFLP